jgi:AAA family ATP:ADP antiporter
MAAVRRRGWFPAVSPGEGPFVLLMSGWFFLVISIFWILKPLKKGLFIEFYDADGLTLLGWHLRAAELELLAKVLNMVVAFVAVVVFTQLARRWRRERLTTLIAGFFVLAFAAHALALEAPRAPVVWSFYLLGDLFSTLMVATFFASLSDSISPDASKRLYGPIGVGGVAGGVVGSSLLGALVQDVGRTQWMWLCIGLVLIVVAVAWLAARARRLLPAASRDTAPDEPEEPAEASGAAWDGALLTLRSSYLLSIVAIVGLYELVSTVMDFQFTSSVAQALDAEAIGVHLSRVFAVTNVVSMLVQLFVTGFVMRRFGVGVALLVLPVMALLSSTAFLLLPGLLTGSALNTADNGFAYSINQSAKEALYVPTGAREKYAAKAFIDMFVQRFAKALAVVLSLGLSAWFEDTTAVRGLSVLTVVLIGVWLVAVRHAGRGYEARSSSR